MPSTLHPHLKRRLYFDDTHHVNPADVVEKTPSESIGAEEKAAKRQRVEKIALQYLQGKRPVILSAGLRGPFNHDWNNPWVETKQKKRSNASKESSADSRRTRSKGRDAVRGTKCTNGKKRIRSAPRKTSEEHMIASPGGPGAIEEDVKQLHESRTLNEVKFEPPTATMSEAPELTLEAQPTQVQIDAALACTSSNGFVYKKIRSSKWTISNAPRSKPRAVNFNSSPTINPDTKRPSKPRSQNTDIGVEGSEPTEAAEGQINEIIQEQQSLGSSHAGRQSVISTQAAMLLAQREFQESSYQSSPNRTPGPWSQSQERTSQTMLPEPSPAITPISVFRPRLGQPYSFSSMHQDPPISTQDLFAAASPFAFSTIKKRAEKPQPNSLEVAMKSFDKLYQNGLDAGLNSPIASAKRIPLKKKNTSENTWNLGFDKGVWSSQESFKGNAGRSGDDVRSSQPEFDTGLDGHGHESSPQFADRLLATKTMVK
ncbi:hypothetical protein GQ44DRAFT_736237 [Phaeosphaeriaceae sp. PMI808]|nr:hypothetical protein GQ44DRAFT_736237 [Phaeosphaeriaceae sp. PMI808]